MSVSLSLAKNVRSQIREREGGGGGERVGSNVWKV